MISTLGLKFGCLRKAEDVLEALISDGHASSLQFAYIRREARYRDFRWRWNGVLIRQNI